MENNQNSKKLTCRISDIIGDMLVAIIRFVIKGLLWIAKHFWKRYFGIETPVYKMWWSSYARMMQKKLDSIHPNY